ncbi:Fpg/Nei family DNA glycosylase [Paenibacillus sp. J2TS4]|uniref:Fpg/Nei family DNA glycosylase n=1 Tax=Paenibacillus sp. J2TS4 TaxID=2807194 RepID=UPI001B27850E|nr:DNA-formamidopyrimidine glycosylase family protein [Paenibacillus sp. J2TS4]GIP32653.1 DNA-formamidopyrimidine glycosylase [Paenibacillus sp. J2TS4]
MPELPEMETYRMLLTKLVVGKPITDVRVGRPKSINVLPDRFHGELVGRTIMEIQRRAKYLIFRLDSGSSLLLHLMLGGWMHFGTEADKPDRNTQVEIDFGAGTLYFIGLRLGFLHLLTEPQLSERLGELGPEPLALDFSEATFRERLQSKKGALKPLLTNQQWIAGIGNCYSDEICFEAGLLPTHNSGEIGPDVASALFRSMRTVLQRAIHKGGYMENPLYCGDGLTGGYNDAYLVYDRGGEACYRCGHSIVSDHLSSRKVFYCSNCQR